MTAKNGLLKKLGISSSDPVERFWENPCGATLCALGKSQQTDEMIAKAIENDPGQRPFLKDISKRKLTYEVCIAACRKCGRNIHSVPKEWLDDDMYMAAIEGTPSILNEVPRKRVTLAMCRLAVDKDRTGEALRGVPAKIRKGQYGRELCELAVEHAPWAIEYVPKELLTEKMMLSAINRDAMTISVLPKSKVTKAVASAAVNGTQPTIQWPHQNGSEYVIDATDWPIAHVPAQLVTQELANLSMELCANSVKGIPQKFLTKQQCLDMVTANPSVYKWIPSSFQKDELIIEAAIKGNPDNVKHVPMKSESPFNGFDGYRSVEKARSEARARFEVSLLSKFNPVPVEKIFDYEIKALDIPNMAPSNALVLHEGEKAIVHEFANLDEPDVEPVYYVSDIHLCHQIDFADKTKAEAQEAISVKVKPLVESLTSERGTVIVAGDVADSVDIARMFYQALKKEMKNSGRGEGHWSIFATLGNHELWDGDPSGMKPVRSVDEVIKSYREMFHDARIYFMQNSLFVRYKRNHPLLIDEQTLLDADEIELREILAESSFIMLGGIGFAGLNPQFNANDGIYGIIPGSSGTPIPRISHEDEIAQSERFAALHEKVLSCAANKQVIIVTHMPMSDWSHTPHNPNWIYISGHTHQNCLIRDEDGTTVLSDNQIGYQPRSWHFNAFTFHGRYDPFEQWGDGIYDISTSQYEDFNNGRGITMHSFKRPGQIRMIKREGVYMFFLQGTNLLILSGGQWAKAEHNIEFYYDNMLLYQQCVRAAFEPYHQALAALSREIKAIGGSGTIHGCIVDIDWWNHVYLNPFDGKITPYFAWNTFEKVMFENIPALLKGAPYPPALPDGEPLANRYRAADKQGNLPILSTQARNSDSALATIPEIVRDRRMYDPSRIMRSIQYIFDQNVIRIWNDEVFGRNVPKDRHLPESTEERRRERPPKALAAPKPTPLSPEEKLNQRAKRYVEKIARLSDGQVIVDVGSYVGGRENVVAKCATCEQTWTLRADKLLSRCYCPKCRKNRN